METVQSETCHCLSSQSFQEGCKTLHQLFVDADLPGIRTELRQEVSTKTLWQCGL